MFNLSAIAANVLNSIDSAAKETLDEPKGLSATEIRKLRRQTSEDEVTKENPTEESPSDEDSSGSEQSMVYVSPIHSKSNDSNNQSFAGNESPEPRELKKQLAAKNKEIDQLNAECLEFEDMCNSLKKEVQDAWNSYKSAQEKAAAKEDELQDEIKSLQKAKQTDKQQFLSQIAKCNADMEAAMEQVKKFQLERDDAIAISSQHQEQELLWKRQQELYENELAEARSGSIQGVHNIREELRNALFANENMKIEIASLLRLNQSRQSELEQTNSQLSQSVAEKQREIARLKSLTDEMNKYDIINPRIEELENQVSQLTSSLDDEKQKLSLSERRVRQLELELTASEMSFKEERKRTEKLIYDLNSQISTLQDKLKDMLGFGDISNPQKLSIDHELANTKHQVQELTKQLLKKQGQVADLQAERSALKSRVQDLQTRYTSAEKQLASLRDPEDDDFQTEDPEEFRVSTNSTGTSLRRRGSNSNSLNTQDRNGNNMVGDLEKIGVKTAPAVAKAVDIIDYWTLVTVRFLRVYPLVRLGLLFYLLFLHVWVIIILAMHTHSLELETDPKEAIIINK